MYISFKKYLFLEIVEGRERGRETSVCGCLSHDPHWVTGLQPWLGIELETLWFEACTQSTELHQPGLKRAFLWYVICIMHCAPTTQSQIIFCHHVVGPLYPLLSPQGSFLKRLLEERNHKDLKVRVAKSNLYKGILRNIYLVEPINCCNVYNAF